LQDVKKNHPDPQMIQTSMELLRDKHAPLRERSRAAWNLHDEGDRSIFELMLRLAKDQTEATVLRERALVHAWVHGESEMWPILSRILQD